MSAAGPAEAVGDTRLPPAFEPPEGWVWGSFANPDGIALRSGRLDHPRAQGTAILVGGFREFAEKYFEVARESWARGFSVLTLDWLGQGGSPRYVPQSDRPWYQGYERDARDLNAFVAGAADPSRPRLLFAHSMGGHIGLRALRQAPDLWRAAVLSAPMLGIVTAPWPPPVARMLAQTMVMVGAGRRYIPGGGDWRWQIRDCPDNPKYSLCPERSLVHDKWIRRNNSLRLGDATHGWLDHAFRQIDQLSAPGVLESITTPILVGVAGSDIVVDSAAVRTAVARLPQATALEVPGAAHELWMAPDPQRAVWVAGIDAFLTGQGFPPPRH